MDEKIFITLANNRFRACMDVLKKKNKEYSRDGDKLHSFKRAAQMLENPKFDCEPEDALVGMWIKHLVSLMDIVDDLPDLPSIGLLCGKITDAINYLVLLEALFMERMDEMEIVERVEMSDESADAVLGATEKNFFGNRRGFSDLGREGTQRPGAERVRDTIRVPF